MKRYIQKVGFTLLEVLIASSILMVIVTLAVGIFYNITRANTYLELTSILQFESKHIMERMMRAVQSNAIDYSEYYNYYALNNGGEDFLPAPGPTWGSNHWAYAARFYNPGGVEGTPSLQGLNHSGLAPDDLGAHCEDPTSFSNPYPPADDPACDPWPTLEYTEDVATGTNPYGASSFLPYDQASAMCDLTTEMYGIPSIANRAGECVGMSNTELHEADMLFLISPDGQEKTLFGLEPWTDDPTIPWGSPGFVGGNVLAMLKLTGYDNDNDGAPELWVCHDDYVCCQDDGAGGVDCSQTQVPNLGNPPNYLSYIPYHDDLNPFNTTDPFEPSEFSNLLFNFSPVSTLRINITDLRFYISPIEDPIKAFDEPPEQMQPYVTIVMTAELNDPRAEFLPESVRSLTLQTTVGTQFYGEITSYVSE